MSVPYWLRNLGAHLDHKLFVIGTTTITPMSFVVFVVTVATVVALGGLASRAIRRYFRKRPTATGMAYALERMVQISALVLGLVIGLQNVGINLTALAAVGAMLSVGIGFGLQGAAQNLISGIALLIERPVQKGDFIVVGDAVGEVDEIRMRATRVVTRDEVAMFIPNSELMNQLVVNMSRPTQAYRVRVRVGVAYGSDCACVQQTLLAVAKEHAKVLGKPEPEVFFVDFGDSALLFDLLVWLDDPSQEPRILSELRFAIDAAFRSEGITIPFPQRDVHLHHPAA